MRVVVRAAVAKVHPAGDAVVESLFGMLSAVDALCNEVAVELGHASEGCAVLVEVVVCRLHAEQGLA
jgi:hypothetical protein